MIRKGHGKTEPNKDEHTVLWGLMLAILRAFSMANSDGLHAMGVFGNATKLGFGWAKWPIMSKIWGPLALVVVEAADSTNAMSSSSSETLFLWVGFRVSKHIIPSKQSSNPSLLRTLTAWTLSAFVKICIYFPHTRCTNHENTHQRIQQIRGY